MTLIVSIPSTAADGRGFVQTYCRKQVLAAPSWLADSVLKPLPPAAKSETYLAGDCAIALPDQHVLCAAAKLCAWL